MKILSAAEMQACDRATTERWGVASGALMRNAARAVAEFARAQYPGARRVTVLCGRGNNGGDGMHVARLLAEEGCAVTIVLLGDPGGLQGDAAEAWGLISGVGGRVALQVVLEATDLEGCAAALQADLVIDAVVGTGFRPPLRGLPLAVLERLKASWTPVLAVDLPSGWDADATTAQQENVYPADAVVTFTAPKPAHAFGLLTRRWEQPIVVAPIGSPEEAMVSEQRLRWAGAAKDIAARARPTDSNKGMYGHVLVVGGSAGKSGAPAMASLAALRTGAGLVTAAVSPEVLPLVASITPELMTHALKTDSDGEFLAENLEAGRIEKLLHRITVLAIGPGLGMSRASRDLALGLLRESRIPAVVDADALNAISQAQEERPELLRELAEGRTLVLTPHPGEMSRLTGLSIGEIQADRLKVAREFAQKHGVTLVLKGGRTLVAHPDGWVGVNTTGNPGMAKGGSGDVLTGMVAAMLAQFQEELDKAVEAAVYLHGLAADMAMERYDEHTLLATDLLDYLPQAFRFRPCGRSGGEAVSHSSPVYSQGLSGYCWLQGLPGRPLT
jgi:NAD(P)H-hydrate epimerase